MFISGLVGFEIACKFILWSSRASPFYLSYQFDNSLFSVWNISSQLSKFLCPFLNLETTHKIGLRGF
jgi:hypothetical protein